MSGADASDLGLLREGSSALGVVLTSDQEAKLLRLVELIYVWNRAAGLTTIARKDAIRLHVLDSLAAVASVEQGPCLDLGTGAGLPGLVLAIACKGVEFVLVESNRKRCSFLFDAVRNLELPNVRVVQSDVESLPGLTRYPVVISRAFRPPAEFLALASGLVAKQGHVVLLAANPSDKDLAELERASNLALEGCRRVRLPGGDEPRAIAIFRAV